MELQVFEKSPHAELPPDAVGIAVPGTLAVVGEGGVIPGDEAFNKNRGIVRMLKPEMECMAKGLAIGGRYRFKGFELCEDERANSDIADAPYSVKVAALL